MIPVAVIDASPFIILEKIGRRDILRALITRSIAPRAVELEVGKLPTWVEIIPAAPANPPLPFPANLHSGEMDVITLGFQMKGSVIILDDERARKFAGTFGLSTLGSVGLIIKAKQEGLLDLVAPALKQMSSFGFHISSGLIQRALKLAGE